MKEILAQDQATDLIKKDGKYYIVYEYGGGASYMREQEVTEEEAMELMEDMDKATPIILKYRNEELKHKKITRRPIYPDV